MNTDKHRTAALTAVHRRTAPTAVPPRLVRPEIADLQLLTMREVRALVGLAESTIREWMAAGRFPGPSFSSGPRCVRWSAGSIRRWLEESGSKR